MRKALTLALLLLAVCLFAGAANADVFYDVTVNTSTFSGQNGDIFFIFSPGITPFLPASVAITDITPWTPSGGAITLSGDSNFALAPPTGTINNALGGLPNYIDIPFTYGNSLAFKLDFSGLALSAPDPSQNGSTFAFAAVDGLGNFLGNNDPSGSGFLITLDIDPDGTTTPNTYGDATITLSQPPNPPGVPEPAAWTLLWAGVAGLGLLRYRIPR